eukprot:SM000087S23417  [mRNA]  locus=s87:464364:465508:- [translate_table: standard]
MMTSLGVRGDRHDIVDFHDHTLARVAHQARQGVAKEVVNAHHFWSSGASQHVSGELSTLCTEAAHALAHPNHAVRWEAEEELKRRPKDLGADAEGVGDGGRGDPVSGTSLPNLLRRSSSTAVTSLDCAPLSEAWARVENGVSRAWREGKEQMAESRMLLRSTWKGKEPSSTLRTGSWRQGKRMGSREAIWCQQPRKTACAVCSNDRQPRPPMRVGREAWREAEAEGKDEERTGEDSQRQLCVPKEGKAREGGEVFVKAFPQVLRHVSWCTEGDLEDGQPIGRGLTGVGELKVGRETAWGPGHTLGRANRRPIRSNSRTSKGKPP